VRVEQYQQRILEAMSPAALLQELGLTRAKSSHSKCDEDGHMAQMSELDSHGNMAGLGPSLSRPELFARLL
jgi:hypothetical protein